ncbi:MAG: acyltransferase family protein [Anaerolineales bacterium]|nr:acyltransferase family protein [Anaerolineales bacterium]
MKRLDQLTSTRFIAILLVLFYHGGGGVYFSLLNIFPISALLHAAPTGVSYLYVLSGFVMSLVYFRPKEKFDIASYWTARFVRIYPLYIISFLMVCYYYIDFVARVKPQKILANIFVLQAWIPTYAQSFNYASWSMTVEFFFYAVFPFFILWAYKQSTKKLIWTSLILWMLSQLIYESLWSGIYPQYRNFIVYFPLFHLNSFIMGAVGGIWFLRVGQDQVIKPSTNLFILAGSIFLAAAYTIASSIFPQLPYNLQPMAGLLAPILTLIIVSLAMDKTRLSIFLNRPALVALGETAYALYILHVPVVWIYERALENSSLANPRLVFDYTFIPLMIAIGVFAHFYIDRPLRNWLKNILKNISMPLLILDLVIIAASVYISFNFRFEGRKEILSYRSTALLMFWSAFLLRTVLSATFNTFNPNNLYGSFQQLARPVLLSVTIGSVVLAGIIFTAYSLGQFENFPRSIFIIDWVLVLGLSLAVRLLFKFFGIYKQTSAPT